MAPPGGATRRRTPGDAARPPLWDREPRTVLRARVELPDGRALVVATTHLTYVTWRAVPQLRRAVSWTGATGAPAVLLGDLNLPHRALGPALAGTGWTPAPPAGPTFPSWDPRMQLDHVLGRGVRLGDVQVAQRGPSDHRAVRARVNIG